MIIDPSIYERQFEKSSEFAFCDFCREKSPLGSLGYDDDGSYLCEYCRIEAESCGCADPD